ncbi:MAG: hypothetical protein J0I09_11485 [Sphingobacteriia bacterium]|nr:hypothetical protein [Sphingobacteriia bacterium]
MKNIIHWKKFILSAIVIFLVLIVVADILIDKIFRPAQFSWATIFGFENLFWKILASLVGAYFYSSEKIKKDKQEQSV